MRITKPYERLVGENRRIVRMILGYVHCDESDLSACRIVCRSLRAELRSFPKELRRGLFACVIGEHRRNRSVYEYVRYGRIK